MVEMRQQTLWHTNLASTSFFIDWRQIVMRRLWHYLPLAIVVALWLALWVVLHHAKGIGWMWPIRDTFINEYGFHDVRPITLRDCLIDIALLIIPIAFLCVLLCISILLYNYFGV